MNFIVGLLISAVLTLLPYSILHEVEAAEGPASFQTSHDTIPNFAYNPTIRSVQNGSWFSTSTWSPARLPGASDVVLIRHVVTYDNTTGTADTIGIDAGGTLTFRSDRATKLSVGTLQVMPSGRLEVGTASSPIAASVTAEIVIKNKPLDLTNDGVGVYDPGQWGTGLLSVDGEVIIHGAIKNPSFVRLASEPRGGNTTLVLDQAVSGWRAGDRLILPDTRHLRDNEVSNWAAIQNQWEELTLQSVSADGRTLTLTGTLRFDHLGARDGNGVLDFLPHVGNLTRNIVIRSETPSGTKGHVLFTQRGNIDIRYAGFIGLGRTTIDPLGASNVAGRYSLHIHHLIGPETTPQNGYQYTLIGNAIDGGTSSNKQKWGIAIHNSHYGQIRNNVVYNYAGSLVAFEDGSESFNVLESNFVVRSSGTGGRMGEGREGGGFWFKGPNNYVRKNIAANIMSDGPDAGYGFKYFQYYLGNIRVPNFKGADTSINGQYTTKDGNGMPILEFADNEVYGATASGFSYWWVGVFGGSAYPRATADSIFKNLHIWHVFNKAIFHYEAMRVIHDGLVIRGKDPGSSAACCGEGVAMNDYTAMDVIFRNIDVQGMQVGITPSTESGGKLQTIENSYLRNRTNFAMGTLWTSASNASWLAPRKVIIRNTRFDAWPGNPLRTIVMNWDPSGSGSFNTQQKDELLVYGYQGNTNDNFQVYYTEQATQPVAGGLAPCNTTRPEIDGLVCPISSGSADAIPPAPPSGLQVSN